MNDFLVIHELQIEIAENRKRKMAMNPQIAQILTDSNCERWMRKDRARHGAWAAPAWPGPHDFVVRVFRAVALPHQRREAATALKTGWPMRSRRVMMAPSGLTALGNLCHLWNLWTNF